MKKKIALILTFAMLTSVLALSGCSSGGPKFEGTWYFYDIIDENDQEVCTEIESKYMISREFFASYIGIDVKLDVSRDKKYALSVNGEEISDKWDADVTSDDSISQIYTLKGINANAYFKKGDNNTLYLKYPAIGVIALRNNAIDLSKAAEDIKTLEENNLSLNDYVEILDEILSRRPDAEITNDIADMLEIGKSIQYEDAIAMKNYGEYEKAIDVFEALGDYKDSASRIDEVKAAIKEETYAVAEKLLADGEKAKAAIAFGKLGDCKDARARSFELWGEIIERETISTASFHTVALRNNGTVIAVGRNLFGQCNVAGWTDIVQISAGMSCTAGLKSDGTVVEARSTDSTTDYTNLTDIVAVSIGDFQELYLKRDGTVVGSGSTSDWTDIVAVSAGSTHSVGLKNDGTVITSGYGDEGKYDVYSWTDIVAVGAGVWHTVGLKSDGTVVAVGASINDRGQCKVGDWTDIVAVKAGDFHTVGLKSDGTVIAVGDNEYGQCNVGDWTDIVAVSAGYGYTIGLKSNGTVVAVGDNFNGQCNVSGWTDIKLPNK